MTNAKKAYSSPTIDSEPVFEQAALQCAGRGRTQVDAGTIKETTVCSASDS